MTSQNGVENIATSKTNSLTMVLVFPIAFKGTPDVTASALGNARFEVQDIIPTPLAFKFTITRTDAPDGWSESPLFTWKAIGREVTDPKGFQEIGKSNSNTLNVTVYFPEPYVTAPDIFAWVVGSFANQITYLVDITRVNRTEFQCTVKRTNAATGWNENPTLCWTIN
ncbi:unnamed protein product [Clavelina lepadiformis]|uniref:Uncharacterized protein n=1 Tax=Clavelina lepadiformis TaxID=159417 RepID=A0ABP0F0M3_CLALP